MDLSKFDSVPAAEDGIDMVILNPVTNVPLLDDDGETPISIRLSGMDSKRFRQASRTNVNNRLKGNRYKMPDAETMESEGLELLVKCTLSWKGIVLDGQTLDCTPANVRKVYTRLPWVREQVDTFMGDRQNFLPLCVKN